MSKKGITGHDEWVVTQALATALVALEQLPEKIQPLPHMEDLRKLLTSGCAPGSVGLHLAQAKCRLFPEADSDAIYREYGLEGDRE
jgi:hypothetical protein